MATTLDPLIEALERERRLDVHEVCRLRRCGLTKHWSDVRMGLFPQPIRQGKRFTRWRAGDVLDFLQSQSEAA